jgi:prepilin-type N-terminal cleavage/methylation domain-containing protein
MQKSLFYKNKKGFTLMELLVVIAIIGILASVSWETLGGVKKKSDATNACEQVASMINKTRNYALSGKVVGASVPTSFSITINNSIVTITNTNLLATETFSIPGGVDCGDWSSTYASPNAIGTGGSITCVSSDGASSRTVTVTPYQAVCN